jgi:pyruvate dehydrogenase E2 component (dihydrolipoamide acetyltransferase)
MPTEFTLPELGENIESGDVVRILVKAGDTISRDQPVVELETDKATIEVPSSVEGTVQEIRVKEGDKVKVGQTILTVEGEAKKEEDAKAQKTEKAQGAPRTQKRIEDTQAQDEAEDAEKTEGIGATSEVPSGRGQRGEVVNISRGTRADAGADAAPAERAPARPGPHAVETKRERGGGGAPPLSDVPAAPSTRRLAREMGVEISSVPGGGPGGRISADDVKAYARQVSAGPARIVTAPLPDFERWGEIDRQPMRAVRRKTAEHLSQAWASIPHVTQFDKADITDLERLREKYGPRAEKAGGKLTVTAIALKVIAAALKQFPQFNASIDPASEEIIYKKYIHIGVAVDTDRGLLVPVIRDVDRKNVVQLASELAQMAEKARNRKLTLEEMEGGCFTITNLGGIGGTYFTPIVNAPEVAILGLSRSSHEPVYRDGQFVPRLMLPLSLSYDHRAIDGADGIRFLRFVAEALEQPFLMALQG